MWRRWATRQTGPSNVRPETVERDWINVGDRGRREQARRGRVLTCTGKDGSDPLHTKGRRPRVIPQQKNKLKLGGMPKVKVLLPGFFICAAFALLGRTISKQPAMKQVGLGATVWTLVLGMTLSNPSVSSQIFYQKRVHPPSSAPGASTHQRGAGGSEACSADGWAGARNAATLVSMQG